MLIFGASGHAKVIIDCLDSQGIQVEGIFDDDIQKSMLLNYPVLGLYNQSFMSGELLIIAIGDNSIREKITKVVKHKFGIVIHKSAQVSQYATIAEGSVLMHNSIIQSGSNIGRHCIVNTAASVDHDCEIGDFVHIAPNAVLCGGVKIGEKTLIGAGATVIPNISIGSNVIIGAGSIVTKNIPDNSIVLSARSIVHERK